MEENELIPADDFCSYHQVSWAFITSLEDAGIIEIKRVEQQHFIQSEQLKELEKLVRLHTELEINSEGIAAIAHLLQRMNELHRELLTVRQKLQFYEH
ncbi:MAG: hypothetical protein JWN76_2200 [Chitinophagaceae bacterium]|nr:hypothetical protein [Chitinophagaceae bacterium]